MSGARKPIRYSHSGPLPGYQGFQANLPPAIPPPFSEFASDFTHSLSS